MKRLIAALSLLTAVIVLCGCSYLYISRSAYQLADTVFTAQSALRGGDLREAHTALQKSYADWQSRSQVFNALVRHNEIDEAQRLYVRIFEALQNDIAEEALIQIADLHSLLLHLPEMEQPRLSNIF